MVISVTRNRRGRVSRFKIGDISWALGYKVVILVA